MTASPTLVTVSRVRQLVDGFSDMLLVSWQGNWCYHIVLLLGSFHLQLTILIFQEFHGLEKGERRTVADLVSFFRSRQKEQEYSE